MLRLVGCTSSAIIFLLLVREREREIFLFGIVDDDLEVLIVFSRVNVEPSIFNTFG